MKLWRLKHKQYVCELWMEVSHLEWTWELSFKLMTVGNYSSQTGIAS